LSPQFIACGIHLHCEPQPECGQKRQKPGITGSAVGMKFQHPGNGSPYPHQHSNFKTVGKNIMTGS
jgi:hypothetical protein